MTITAAFEFLRRALVIGGDTLAGFHETEAARVILEWAEATGAKHD